MKTMILAFVAIVVIAFGAQATLDNLGFSTQDRATGPSVRLD